MSTLRKPSAVISKFSTGDRVRILPEGQPVFAGAEGVIDDVCMNERGISILDQYTVLFEWGEKKTFFEVQLELTAK